MYRELLKQIHLLTFHVQEEETLDKKIYGMEYFGRSKIATST